MTHFSINGQSLLAFGFMLLLSSLVISWEYYKTNNVYRIMKKQTRGYDYEKTVFKLWLPFIAIILLMIGLCILPFYVIDPPQHF